MTELARRPAIRPPSGSALEVSNTQGDSTTPTGPASGPVLGGTASVLLVGLSHHSAPLSMLEKVAVSESDRRAMLAQLLSSHGITEAMLVTTCNRVEAYVVSTDPRDVQLAVIQRLAEHAGLEAAELVCHSYVHRGDKAVQHLFEVAAGLDSLVVGDAQILGQVRSAYAASTDSQAAGPVLHPLVQQAFRVGKRVARDTHLAKAGPSVVTAALQSVNGAQPNGLAGRRALVLGAGALGAVAVAELQRAGVRDVMVVNRTPSRADQLSARSESAAVHAVSADNLVDALADADVVLACTASPTAMISAAQAEAAVARRGDGRQHLLICDLGMPRNVDPAVAAVRGVKVIDLQTLPQVGLKSAAEQDVGAARTIVATQLTAYQDRSRAVAAESDVATLHEEAATIMRIETARLHARMPDLDSAAQAEVVRSINRVAGQLLHAATTALKQATVHAQDQRLPNRNRISHAAQRSA